MNCLPTVGGPAAALFAFALLVIALGSILLWSRHALRSLGVGLILMTLLMAGTIVPSDSAHATADDCPPTSQSSDGDPAQEEGSAQDHPEDMAQVFAVQYEAGPGGSIEGQTTQSVTEGQDASPVTAVPDEGYRFVQWSDGSAANPRTDTAVTADLDVTAEFSADLDLAPGESHRSPVEAGAPQVIGVQNSDSDTAQYLLVPSNTAAQDATLQLQISGNLSTTAGYGGQATQTADPHTVDRRSAVAVFEDHRGGAGSGTPLSPAARVPHGVVPAVGDIWQLNRSVANSCSAGEVATAQVRAVGTHAVIVVDEDNPPSGVLTSDYEGLLDTVDSVVYPSVTDTFGEPSDIDGNDRIVLFVTRGVNEHFATSNSPDIVLSRPRDLLTQDECAVSNVGEVFFMMAPDPTGSIGGQQRTVPFVLGGAPAQLAHELGHHIADAQDIATGRPLDTSWLAEALADSAIDRAFYAASAGLEPLSNIALATLVSGPNASTRAAAFNAYTNANFGRLRTWLQWPAHGGPLSGAATLPARGGGWAFLRYAADRHADGSLAEEAAFFAALVAGEQSGSAALTEVIGADVQEWVQDFLVALHTDDLIQAGPWGTSGPWSITSWNYRSVYEGLGGYLLRLAALDVDETRADTYAGHGGGGHLLFAVGAGQTATLTFAPDRELSYTLIRLE